MRKKNPKTKETIRIPIETETEFQRAFSASFDRLAYERADCKPINSVIANSWAQAETH